MKRSAFIFFFLLLIASPVGAQGIAASDAARADSTEQLRAQYRLDPVPDAIILEVVATGLPSTSVGSPSAFGADWGEVFAAAGYQERVRYSPKHDGTASVGVGLGNAHRWVALEVTLTSYDTATEFMDTRGLSAKLHRRLPGGFAVAVGMENLLHTSSIDGGQNTYVVGSKILKLRDLGTRWFTSAVLSLGAGNGRFQDEEAFYADEDGWGVFGAAAVQAHEQASLIADWTGQDLMLGLSIVPLKRIPIIVTPAVADVTGRAGDGARFVIGFGVAYSFR